MYDEHGEYPRIAMNGFSCGKDIWTDDMEDMNTFHIISSRPRRHRG